MQRIEKYFYESLERDFIGGIGIVITTITDDDGDGDGDDLFTFSGRQINKRPVIREPHL